MGWVDVARAVAVLAIVLMHFQIWVIAPYVGHSLDVTIWTKFIEQLNAFHLPLLFVLSGFLVADRVRSGFSDRRTLVSAARSYYLYVVWLAIYWLMSMSLETRTPMGVPDVGSFISQLVLPRSILWFVLALAVYVLVFSALSRFPAALMLPASALLTLSTVWMPGVEGADLYRRVVYYAFFFGIGVYLKPALLKFTSGPMARKLLLTLSIYIILFVVSETLPLSGQLVRAGLRLARETGATFAVIAIVVLLCRVSFVARPLASIGRQTLPIYVLHLPAIWVFLAYPNWEGVFQSAAVRALMPFLAVVVIVSATLLIHKAVIRTPARVLFEMPSAWADRILRKGPRRIEAVQAAAPDRL
ncbi:hypothetical protein ASC66_09490 [Leifsonia sp. Root4]|nr:hypothetical protein ASC66_09490 [Leifsonia sp. Root4]